MNKVYEKPWIEIEYYTLDASIAANCGNIVTLGPDTAVDANDACHEFEGDFGVYSARSGNTSFYAADAKIIGCDCYYSSSGQGYFTS